MIVRLDKEQIKSERRKLLGDVVYILTSDILKQLQKEGKTSLSHVESYLSAREFAKLLLSLTDAVEGIDDELQDLEDEVEGTNDALIISMVAAIIVQAMGKSHPQSDVATITKSILARWCDYPLADSILFSAARKEEKRWMDGKRTQLLDYEIGEIERANEGDEKVREVFEYFVGMAGCMDCATIKANLLILNKYNMNHGNRYDDIINKMYQCLDTKSTTHFHIDKINDIHGNKNVKIGQ